MLKEGALRKKLQDTGIPSWGTKDLMRRRHIEWLNIHNSNCDADESVRKNKRQLLKELDEWEQTQGGRADTKESKIMKKDFDGTGYAKSHKTDFDDLIARARQQRNTPQPGSEESRPDQQPSELRSSHVNLDVDTAPSNQHPSDTKELPHPNPYENRESPLASIRAEVEQPNTANSHVPTLPSESSMDRSLLNEEGLQNPFSSQNRKVPMFALPEEAMRDVEGGTTVQ
jgi:E3 ubiquitin-protein ligase RAD18